VQFFKFNSASPVSVRTRVRHLPHIITGSSNSSSSSSSKGCGAGKTRCFLEVNVQNSTGLVMQLHAVRLLAAPGVVAEQIAPLSRPQQQQQQQHPAASQQWQQQVLTSSHHQQHDQQQQHGGGKGIGQQAQLAPADAVGSYGSSDTEMLQDIDSFAGGCSSMTAPSVQQKQQQQQLSNHFDHSQQHQQQDRQLQLPGQSTFAPFGTPEQQQLQQQEQQHIVHLLAGCSHNSLWQVDHHLCGGSAVSSNGNTAGSSSSSGPLPPAAASAGATGVSGPSSNGSSSSSSSTLGRLELHWSTCDGRTGRLLTQPLTGPVPASGKEVLMQLHQVMPGAPPSPALLPSKSLTGPQQLAESLSVNTSFTAMFTLTAGPVDTGPLLVLYTTTVPLTTSSSGSTGGLASSSSVQLGTDSSSIQSRRMGGNAVHTGPDSSSPEVVVQGSRSRRVPGLAAGQSLDVAFELLPLRCGWLRLPTFVVASETDGRLLDGVHDVHILVV
jgi:hypothetical protein